MSFPIYVVVAFAAEAFRGNQAAVVLGDGDDVWMQRVAAEMRHSETAFLRLRSGNEFDLRWFTPEVKVDLCGHATLASAHVLYESERVASDATVCFHTRGGELRAEHSGAAGITLDFPVAEPRPEPEMPGLFDALGITPREFLRTDGDFFMCVVDDASTVRALAPDFAKLATLQRVRGVYVTAPGDLDYDIVSRCFA